MSCYNQDDSRSQLEAWLAANKERYAQEEDELWMLFEWKISNGSESLSTP